MYESFSNLKQSFIPKLRNDLSSKLFKTDIQNMYNRNLMFQHDCFNHRKIKISLFLAKTFN